MTTRNLVPRADGEGSLGTAEKQWGAMRAKKVYIDGTDFEEVLEDTLDAADAADDAKTQAAASATEAAGSVVQAEAIKNAMIAAYGYPLTAATAADMTDTTKIYVYTGSETGYTFGDWYYHNGTAWTDGGVYNAIAFNTDPTLSISGGAADAKAVGDFVNQYLTDVSIGTTTDNTAINKQNGNIIDPVSGSFSTDFIAITPNAQLAIKNAYFYSQRGTCFYDADKQFISSVVVEDTTTSSIVQDVTVTVPYNASFIRLTGKTGYTLTVKLDKVVTQINGKIDKNLGVENAGKFLVVDDDGDVTPESVYMATEVVSNALATYADFTYHGYLDSNTGSYTATEGNQRTTDYIALDKYTQYGITGKKTDNTDLNIRTAVIYNADYTYSRSLNYIYGAKFELNADSNEKYIRINTGAVPADVAYVYLYKLAFGYGSEIELKSEIDIPKLDTLVRKQSIPYIHAREPQIAFILDGAYADDVNMHTVFNNHGVKAGFALPWNRAFDEVPISTYYAYQEEGHEILCHGNYPIPEDTAYTDAEAIEFINTSIKRMNANGFHPKAWIGSHGAVAERFVPYIKKLYEWAATTSNHDADREPCIFFGVDKPYYLWRYTLQHSTLQQQKDAVDRALANNGLLLFYGHARVPADPDTNFTTENLDALLTYIESVGGVVKTPSEAVMDYFALRYDDIYNIINA